MSAPRPGTVGAVRIVHRDDHLLVLEKPSGLPTTAPSREEDCLVLRAEALDPDAPKLHATSRLDADVTGLVTFARTKEAAEALRTARREGRYGRRYEALTLDPPEDDEGEWAWPIAIHGRDKRRRVALVNSETEHGAGPVKESRTRFRVIARGTLGAELHLFPETGRTHQLRVHALAAGAGLFGDRVYQCPTRVARADGRVITARRVMLHCAELRIPDVAAQRGGDAEGEGMLTLTSAPPADFRRAAEALLA